MGGGDGWPSAPPLVDEVLPQVLHLEGQRINVETFKRMAQLSGFVRSQADIDKAVQVAGAIAGVKSVKNDMRVK